MSASASQSEPSDLPAVLRCLFEEHRHLAALMETMDRKAGQEQRLRTGEYYLLRDIVGYMHEYPDAVHHPTENRLFKILLKRMPSKKADIDRLRRDHQAVARETDELLKLLDEAIEKPSSDREGAVREACRAFTVHQRAHMQFENTKMFPAAIDSLSPADWKQIESDFADVDDPLFGAVVEKQHRLLYEYLLNPAERAAEKLTGSRLFSLERLILTIDIFEDGASAWARRLIDLGIDVSEESRSAVERMLKPESPGSALRLPADHAAYLGRSVVDCSGDLFRIYARTLKKGVRAFFL